MAGNEERIRVSVSKNPCEKCDIKPCTRKCMFRTLFEKAPGMTRQEAIEKIKKSLKKIQCWSNSFNDSIAEAALNALLGEPYDNISIKTEIKDKVIKCKIKAIGI